MLCVLRRVNSLDASKDRRGVPASLLTGLHVSPSSLRPGALCRNTPLPSAPLPYMAVLQDFLWENLQDLTFL